MQSPSAWALFPWRSRNQARFASRRHRTAESQHQAAAEIFRRRAKPPGAIGPMLVEALVPTGRPTARRADAHTARHALQESAARLAGAAAAPRICACLTPRRPPLQCSTSDEPKKGHRDTWRLRAPQAAVLHLWKATIVMEVLNRRTCRTDATET